MLNGIVRLLVDGIALVGLIGGMAAFVPGHHPRPDAAAVERLASRIDLKRQEAPVPSGTTMHLSD
jgi:hypothetical protein